MLVYFEVLQYEYTRVTLEWEPNLKVQKEE